MDASSHAPSGARGETREDVVPAQRRYVPVGKRIVPLSVLIAVVAVAAAAFFAWRLYTPQWAGGVGRVTKQPQPSESKVENAPGPDNTIKTMPPPDQLKPPVSSDKKGGPKKESPK
jgi:hypothetical protein